MYQHLMARRSSAASLTVDGNPRVERAHVLEVESVNEEEEEEEEANSDDEFMS